MLPTAQGERTPDKTTVPYVTLCRQSSGVALESFCRVNGPRSFKVVMQEDFLEAVSLCLRP